ncbi:MAG: hypothetical protein WBA39_32040 [Rivularia sp. (in: cyanobacteria)]
MNKNLYTVQQPSRTLQNSQLDKLAAHIQSQSGLVLLSCFALFGIFKLISGSNNKGKVATSYWGGSREKSQAAKKAKKQISKPIRNSVGLYVGTPPYIRTALQKQWYKGGLLKTKPNINQQLLSSNSTLYVPDAQRGIAVIGAAGSGKTFSVIDPLIRSTFDQGFPMLLYDFKFPAQTVREL